MAWAGSLWAYLKVPDPYVAWEVYRGHLISAYARDMPDEWSPISSVLASALREGQELRLQHELVMERIRRDEFPDVVSRLRVMYFFEDRQAASRASSVWKDVPGYFTSRHLAELGFVQAPRTSRHDSIWIDREMWRETPFDLEDEVWIRHYWGGEPATDEPLWEVLAEGEFWVLGTQTRELAHDTIAKQQPRALGMLELARVAADIDSSLGHCTPLVSDQGVKQTLRYFIDFRDATNPEFLARLREYDGPKNTAELNAQTLAAQGLIVPDFLDREFDFTVPVELANLLMNRNASAGSKNHIL